MLQDNVPGFPFDAAKRIIEEDLGQPLEELYDSFSDVPLAAASLGQVQLVGIAQGGGCCSLRRALLLFVFVVGSFGKRVSCACELVLGVFVIPFLPPSSSCYIALHHFPFARGFWQIVTVLNNTAYLLAPISHCWCNVTANGGVNFDPWHVP